MIIKELFVLLGFEVDDAGMKKAQDALARVRDIARGVAVTVGLAGAALYAVTREAAQQSRDLTQWATRLGTGVRELSRLDYAAVKTLGSSEKLREGMADLAEKASQAFRDQSGQGEMTKAFGALGVSVADSNGHLKSAVALYRDVSDKIAAMKNRTQATAIAMQLFGGGVGRDLIPLLALGSQGLDALGAESDALGVTLSEGGVAAGVQMAQAMDVLRLVLGRLVLAIGVGLAPEMVGLIRTMLGWIRTNRQLVTSGVIEFFRSVIAVFRALLEIVARAFILFKRFSEAIGGVDRAMGLLAAIVGLGFLASIAGALGAVSKLTAGMNLLSIATLRAGAAPILAGMRWVAIAAVFLLLLEDIVYLVNGDGSAVGELIKEMGKLANSSFNADDHPLINLLRGIAKWVKVIKDNGWDVIRIMFGGALADRGGAVRSIWDRNKGALPEGLSNWVEAGAETLTNPPLPDATVSRGLREGANNAKTWVIDKVILPGVQSASDFARELDNLGVRPGAVVE